MQLKLKNVNVTIFHIKTSITKKRDLFKKEIPRDIEEYGSHSQISGSVYKALSSCISRQL